MQVTLPLPGDQTFFYTYASGTTRWLKFSINASGAKFATNKTSNMDVALWCYRWIGWTFGWGEVWSSHGANKITPGTDSIASVVALAMFISKL